jgi:hypothetical protein
MTDGFHLTALVALALWPVVAIGLYRSLPLEKATLWTMLGGALILPLGTVVKIPMIPQFDKGSIPTLCAALGCLITAGSLRRATSRIGIFEVFLAVYVMSPIVTSLLNQDPIAVEDSRGAAAMIIPGVGLYDAFSACIVQSITILPMLIGRRFLRSASANEDILRTLIVAGLFYTIPMLIEVRLSPQFHVWIYGYFPSAFSQAMREGGFRPVVFLGHGLLVAFFLMTSLVAAAAFWRTKDRVLQLAGVPLTAYLGVVLLLCKTLGALVYAILLVPVVRFGSPKNQIRVAVCLAIFVLAYPTSRLLNLSPDKFLMDAAMSISADRAKSLEFRLDNERQLTEKTSERLWFGWGRYGRNRIYNEYGDQTITDGHWIITLGQFGLVGFIAEFGLLTLPIFAAARAFRSTKSRRERIFLTSLTLIVAIGLLDQIPNASISPWAWLLSGALLGRTGQLRALSSSQVVRRTVLGAKVTDAQDRQPAIIGR